MSASLPARLWAYQSERFPLKRNLPLLAVFAAASLSVSSQLAGRPLPGIGAFLAAAMLAVIVFFQMRAADEWKDRDIDRRYRSERAIPRGLVSLQEVIMLGALLAPIAIALAWGSGVLWLLVLVWVWFAAMTAEFGMKDWLVQRPVLYLLSHMAILPLIDLMLTGIEWVGNGAGPGLWIFLALTFVNGCVLEIGRKCWSPENEREGVESYSRLWGTRRAVVIWAGCVGLASVLLSALGLALGTPLAMMLIALTGAVASAIVAWRFWRVPTPDRQAHLDAAAGLWVLLCYTAAGGVPLIGGG